MDKDSLPGFSKFVARYKQLIKDDNNAPEIYKWECVFQFQKSFNIEAPDFERMLRDSVKKARNLIYVNSLGFILRAVKYFPENIREMFRELYDENLDFQSRLETFQKKSKDLLPDVIEKHGKPLNHQQDERTISFYMAMRYPGKYPLFKDDIYKELLDIFSDEQPKKAGKKYVHFIELSKRILPFIESDQELKALCDSKLNPECFSGNQNLLIFQDILWRNKAEIKLDYKIKYYLVGAYWNDEDQTTRLINKGIWENGDNDKFLEETNSIEAGSKIAIKAVHTEGKTTSVMTIKAIGTVTKNYNDGRTLDVEWRQEFEPFKVGFSGGYWSTVHRVENENHINAIFFRIENENLNINEMMAKNIILYGPPGTGKTYNSIDKAIEIALGKSVGDHQANKREFDRLRKEGQIEFVTFHQNYNYEDFMVGIAPDVTSVGLRFDKKEGIFKRLNDLAKNNWLASINSSDSRLDFDHVFNSFFSKLIEEETKEVEIPMRSKGYDFKITKIDLDDGRIKFTKKSGGTGHDLLVKNVKGIYDGTLDYAPEGLGVYYYPLVEKLKEYALEIATADSANVGLKKYVMVIDEINRANISKVFGELITLLEEDKRLGELNELKITLPNGEKEFGIPPNVFLIGTMNTADKSIALVDIALRRRFEFIGYYPSYESLGRMEADLLQKVNEAIYDEKKSADYLIGHAYFMQKQPIENILKTKVIPLLMEYFSGRTETVTKIFNNTDWNVAFNRGSYSWDITPK